MVSGQGSIVQAGATTTVAQASQNLSLTWASFNIAPQETVNFLQPSASAIAVNRIADTNGTQILGRLNANGQVYLINPNGILFGQDAQLFMHGTGMGNIRAAVQGAMMRTHVRVGQEDNLFERPGVPFRSNAAQVEKLIGILDHLTIETATISEARGMLGLERR